MIPQYELFNLPPSAFAIDPETPPLPRWLMLAFGVAVPLVVGVVAALG